MAFNPIINGKKINLYSNTDNGIDQPNQEKITENKTPNKNIESKEINHKSNIFRIIKTTTELSVEDSKELTIKIEKYISQYILN